MARPTSHLLSSIPSSRFERGTGVMAMFIACYSVPNAWLAGKDLESSIGGAAASQQLVIFAVVTLFAVMSTRFELGPYFELLRGEPLLPLLLGFTLASAMWSVVPDKTFRLSAGTVAVCVVAYWLAARFPVSTIIGMAGVALGIGTVFQLFLIKFFPAYTAVGSQWVGLLRDRNVFGRSVSLAVLVLLLCWRIFPRYRVIIWGLLAVNALFLYRADSKTSTVAAAALPVMFAIFTVFRARRTLYGSVAIVMGLGAVGAFVFTARNSGELAETLDRNPNLSSRTPIWEAVIPEIKAKPFIGHGVGGFFTDDWAGPARQVFLTINQQLPHAHNALLNMLLDLGVIGAGLFLAIFVKFVVRGARVVRYYGGPVGMFPLMVAGYVLLNSVTEYGMYTGDLHLMLLVVAICAAMPGRRDELRANVPTFDRSRRANSSSLRRHPPTPSVLGSASVLPIER